MIRHAVVEKIIHPRLREKLLQDPDLNFEKVLTRAEAFERALREAAVMTGQPATPVVAKLVSQPPRPSRALRGQQPQSQQGRHSAPGASSVSAMQQLRTDVTPDRIS